jgi:DNA polymerase-3 subunit delta
MPGNLSPDYVLDQLKKGRLFPFYLFYGPNEFQLEKVLINIRETFIPEETREFNLQIFYAEKGDSRSAVPAHILDSARSLPFMSQHRLIIVRRTEALLDSSLDSFLSYLDNPVESTCLIFISLKPDFRKKFYKKLKDSGRAVFFKELYENQIVPWIKNTAKDLDLKMETQACAYLQQIVGNRLIDLYPELEKLSLRYGEMTIAIKEVRELAIHSRIYTIFELMDEISSKSLSKSISALNRFLEEDREAPIRIIGMLNRQIRLMWQIKSYLERGGSTNDMSKKLGLRDFQIKRLIQQSKNWKVEELERAIHLTYDADRRIKLGSPDAFVLENLLISLGN